MRSDLAVVYVRLKKKIFATAALICRGISAVRLAAELRWPPLPVPSATATTSVTCLCACAGGYLSSLATGSCAWPCRTARPPPLHVIIISRQQAPNASRFRSGCSGCEATFRLCCSSAAERGVLSSVNCMAARRLRGLLAASRMERSRRRCRVPDVSSQYLRRSHSACRRRTPTK